MGAHPSAYDPSRSTFVWRVLRQKGVPEPALEQVTAEVLSRAVAIPGRPDPRPELHQLAQRAAATRDRSAYRKRRKSKILPLRPELDAAGTDRARLSALTRAVERLALRQRDVFMLAEIEQMSVDEIAACLKIRAERVASRLLAGQIAVASVMADRGSFVGSARQPESLDEQTRADLATLRDRAAPDTEVQERLTATLSRQPQAGSQTDEASRTPNRRLIQAGAATLGIGALLLLGAALREQQPAESQASSDSSPASAQGAVR